MKYVKDLKSHDIDGLIEIQLDPFLDKRGEIWSIYEDCEIFPKFVEDKVTVSRKNVLRGLHGDYDTHKLICCMHGEIFLAVVDVRKDSQTFKSVKTFHLTEKKPTMILVPPGRLNGHVCLTEKCVFFYKWSKKYSGPDDQITVRWSDPDLNIHWPTMNPTLSERDENGKTMRETVFENGR